MRISFCTLRTVIRTPALLAIIASAFGCGETVAPEDVAGTYQATQWTLTGAADIDVLAEGGSIEVQLQPDRSTTGLMIVPDAASDRGQYAVDMIGTFVITGGRLRFNQAAESFIRNLIWEIADGRLVADGFFAGTEIIVVLTRVE